MLAYTYQALHTFRKVFSRRSTWLTFCLVVLGFIGATRIDNVSSWCRFWHLQTPGYLAFLHFFRSSAWSLTGLLSCWGAFVLSQQQTVTVDGRAVLLGDHTMTAKDGRRMPGVVTLHQDSETQSKPNYFRGHFWGAIGLLAGTLAEPFCLPLSLRIHQGFTHLRQPDSADQDPKTSATRLVHMALDFTLEHNRSCLLVLDAFFSVASVFTLAASVWSVALHKPLVTILVRAKKSYVAYCPAEQPPKPGRGRPRKYGDKVKLYEVFDHMHLFERTRCQVYGAIEDVSYLAADLLWKPTGELIRFVFALSSRGPIVLMCSDLAMHPVMAIELYCTRVRVETLFAMLKHLIGAFGYHFWSKRLPRHSRKPRKNQRLKQPSTEDVPQVQSCWECYERFVMLAAIALGLLQLIALKFSPEVWGRFNTFLRTRSRPIPSERTVKDVMAQMVLADFLAVAPSATMQEIRDRFLADEKAAQDSRSSTEKEAV
jgi:DDE superfamily endonuclease